MSYQSETWNFLISKGLTELSVSAIMGNIQAESGFDPSLIEAGNGIGFGLCQWSFGRRTQLEAYGTDFNHQLNFLWSELSGENLSETGADFQWLDQAGYLTHMQFMEGVGSLDDLTSAFCFCWERPNFELAHLEFRQEWALNYYNEFTGTTPPDDGNVKLKIAIEFGTNRKISYLLNDFELIKNNGNTVVIKNKLSNRKHLVRKSYVKIL